MTTTRTDQDQAALIGEIDQRIQECPCCGEHWCDNCNLLDRILTLLQAGTPTAQTWQPIATAPKDGTHILAWCKQWKDQVIVVWFYTGSLRWNTAFEPTHWMPLPPAPSAQEGK